MIYFKLLPELPPPPEHILNSIDVNLNPELLNFASGYQNRTRYIVQDKQRILASKFYMSSLDDAWTKWVNDNIAVDVIHTGVAYRKFSSSSSGIHTDGSRNNVLIWPITLGGDNTVINFYRDPNKQLIQAWAQHYESSDMLKLIDSFSSPINCWYYIRGDILHSVENLSSNRVQLQIGLKSTPSFVTA